MSKRIQVWKHSCAADPEMGLPACARPCDDPWQVDMPFPYAGGTFATFAEAIAYADWEAPR